MFLPNNGAFFVSYAITAVFVRTGLDLLRIPELILYIVWRARAKTRRQRENALSKVRVYVLCTRLYTLVMHAVTPSAQCMTVLSTPT